MPDRPRNPDRAGLFSDANPPDPSDRMPSTPRHPASPPPIEPPKADWPGAIDDETEGFARTLRDLIESLPHRSGSSSLGAPAPAPEGISGIATLAVEDSPADERRAQPGGDVLAGDTISFGADRANPPTEGPPESSTVARTDLGWANGRDEIVPMSSTSPLPGVPSGDLTGYPAPDRPRDSIGASVIVPAYSDGRGSSEENSIEGPRHFVVETTATGAFGDVSAAGGFSTDREPSDAMSPGSVASAGASSETVAVGPIGPAGRQEEDFDRASSPSAASMAMWDASPGGDPLGGGSSSGEGTAGVDMGPTNALLGQILDELRRQQQAPIARGRSVYPER